MLFYEYYSKASLLGGRRAWLFMQAKYATNSTPVDNIIEPKNSKFKLNSED